MRTVCSELLHATNRKWYVKIGARVLAHSNLRKVFIERKCNRTLTINSSLTPLNKEIGWLSINSDENKSVYPYIIVKQIIAYRRTQLVIYQRQMRTRGLG